MKTQLLVNRAILLTMLLSASYWFGYHHGAANRPGRLNDVSQLRQVGMSFRGGHNDISRFKAAEQIQAPKKAEQGK